MKPTKPTEYKKKHFKELVLQLLDVSYETDWKQQEQINDIINQALQKARQSQKSKQPQQQNPNKNTNQSKPQQFQKPQIPD